MKIFIAIIAVIMMTLGVKAGEPTNTAPAGYWSFDQADIQKTKLAKDNSGNNHPAKLIKYGSKTILVAGRRGTAVHFSTNDGAKRDIYGAVRIKNPGIDFTKPFTIEMWVEFDKEGNFTECKEIIGNVVADRGPGFRLTKFYGRLRLRSGDGKAYWDCKTNSSKTVLPCDKWIFLAITFDGEKAAIFINGVKVAEKIMKITSGRKDISVGAYNYGYAYPMAGAVDELKIYTHAKTDLEVSAAYLKNKN